jgi:hypothetical protein
MEQVHRVKKMPNMITKQQKAAEEVKKVETLTGYGDVIAVVKRGKRKQIRER